MKLSSRPAALTASGSGLPAGDSIRGTVAALPWRTLPHEWAFGAMLLWLALRLLWQGPQGAACAGLLLACFLTGLGLTGWCTRQPSPLRWRIRLGWYFLAMGLVFYTLPTAVQLLGAANADRLLQSADRLLLARPVADYFDIVQSPALTEIMVLAYLFFFWYLLLGPAYYCFGKLRDFRCCVVGLFCIYAAGLLAYSALPAGGPHLAQHFATALPMGPLGRSMLPLIDRGSNGIDVFPSIHVAVSTYLLGFDALHHRRRFRRLLLPCLLLCISTLYLRYHYLVDLLAGAALALGGLVLAQWYRGSRLEREVQGEG
jgi:membrane-associated phospholipid phosphatase